MVGRQRDILRAGSEPGRPRAPGLRLCLAAILLLLPAACAGVQPPAVAPATEPAAGPPASTSPRTPPDMPASLAALAGPKQGITFAHLPPDAGLSQSVVLDFVQDDQGFLWLATQDGLNRYDGYEFRVFREDPAQPGGLQGTFIYALDRAPSGEIWIGTNDGGLNVYDPQTGRFSSYPHDPQEANSLSENAVPAVAVDPEGIVWAGTSNSGLNRLDPRSGQVRRYLSNPDDPDSLSANSVTAVLADGSGPVWVGTLGGGLNRLDPGSGRFRRYQNDPDDPYSLSDDAVQSLYLDRQGSLWVGTFGGGLNRLDPQAGGFVRYEHNPADATTLGHNSVSSILEDGAGRLWLTTQGGGLNRLDRATGRFTRYQHETHDPASISNDTLMSLFEDRSGILWVGTFGSGADYYDPYRNRFLHIRSRPDEAGSLSSESLWGMVEDEQGHLWVGTNGGGLNRFDPQAGAWRAYRHDPADEGSLGNDIVYGVYLDRGGVLWAGTPTELNRFDRQSETFRRYPIPLALALYEDSRGDFWVGSSLGLALLDRETGATVVYANDPLDPESLSSNALSILLEDREGRFWAGTLNGGLNLFDRDTGRCRRYLRDAQNPASLSSNVVIDLFQARDGSLWLGTAGGLNRFDPQTEAFTAYREKDGLPSDTIYGILEDEQGFLWLSTNGGLSRFDPGTLTFRNYEPSDGLQGYEYNQWSRFRNREGVLFFGGVHGLNAFHPDGVLDNPFFPPLVLTRFEIYRQPVPVGPDSPLRQPIEVSSEVQLRYTDDSLEFQYAALHFSAPDRIQYAYLMEGLDKDWNEVGNRRFATYTNVPPGNYLFRLKGTNSDGVWNEEGVTLQIRIPPPFWQTTWFRLLLAVAALGGLSGLFWLRIQAVERQRQRLEVQVQERTQELRQAMQDLEQARDAAEAASRAKSAFLANMSHEFRTPLNAILGFTQILSRDRRLPPDQREEVQIIHRSSEHLLGLINDVLDMSKIEAGRTTLNRRAFNLHRLLAGLEEMFALRAEAKGLALRLDLGPEVPRYVWGDDGKLRQVLMNLLGNAVKFTPRGEVWLRARVVDGSPGAEAPSPQVTLRLAVEDSGPGIDPEEVPQLFVPFAQAHSGRQSQEGTGLGLAISQQFVRLMGAEIQVRSRLGMGSCFSFDLPLESAGAGDLEQPPPTRRVAGLAPGQPTYRLLVVDDQEANRRLLVRLFEPLGFEVRQAANGQEALEVWEAWQPHLVWMDMRMPVMDGYEATRRIKATTRGMATIVVALTASALEEERAVILSEGCDDYVRKPFQEEELFDILARHLGVRYRYEELAVPAGPDPKGLGRPLGSELAARLRAMDPGWRRELERATLLGDQQAIRVLAGQVARRDPGLAEDLTRLAGRFEHDQILRALHEARPGENDESER
jgi:signal transduction histidine kinase/ligand-binding sensor domain-containing protein/DNA-binding response OmpR family regulator